MVPPLVSHLASAMIKKEKMTWAPSSDVLSALLRTSSTLKLKTFSTSILLQLSIFVCGHGILHLWTSIYISLSHKHQTNNSVKKWKLNSMFPIFGISSASGLVYVQYRRDNPLQPETREFQRIFIDIQQNPIKVRDESWGR